MSRAVDLHHIERRATVGENERVDLEVIEALDFQHAPNCEHSQHTSGVGHDGPAAVLVAAVECPTCGDPAVTLYLCEMFWRLARETGVTCEWCLGPIESPYVLLSWVKS